MTLPRPWTTAATIGDLGTAMAGWIDGRLPARPGYFGPAVDEETIPLVPTLIALCRAGYVTSSSQPGDSGRAFDGRPYRQRAGIEGVISATHPALDRLLSLKDRGLIVCAHGPRHAIGRLDGETVTEWGGRPYTWFGRRLSPRELRAEWHGIGDEAMKHLATTGVQLTVIDPRWGIDTGLWSALRTVLTGRSD
ncbi:DUF6919 domain-containing protein [Streptomyces sp. NPDC093225]|uniref:DUF6919 domain-containing protein n=1 Tax=Streptomyces sp. NPDC093225 TaxID=3366034 RepID=UPI00382B26E0